MEYLGEKLAMNNPFTISYYSEIINFAKKNNYKFVTLKEFIDLGYPSKNHFIMRHDLDTKPQTLKKMLDTEIFHEIRSSIFVRVTANQYNVLSYPVIDLLNFASENGFELGLHTSCVEYAKINELDTSKVLQLEYSILNSFFNIHGVAPHRDLNYMYNSLPYIEKNWDKIEEMGLKYQAYDKLITDNCVYINEGFNPHLCWRKEKPEDVIPTGKSIYMLTHNHWWYDKNPFEEWQ